MGFGAVRKNVDCTMAETAQHLSSYILSIFGCSHQAISLQGKTVRKKKKTKLSLKKYLGVLVFEVLAFEVLAFEVLAFEVLAFEVLVFDFLKFFIF